ncbi:MAG: MFS transporter [Planctomycetota bacterium]
MNHEPHSSVSKTLTVGEKVGYGLGDCASNLYWKTWEFFLVYFYTDVFGLTARSTGQLMLATRMIDAISDPLVGYLADRTRTAWGRFRPYLLWLSLPLAVTAVLTFMTPDLSPRGKLIYAYATYTAAMIAYTAINIPYGALMGVISPNSEERTSVSTYRFVAAFCGGLMIQWLMLDLVRWFGGTSTIRVGGVTKEVVINEPFGFTATMAIFGVLAVGMFLITFATTRERVEPEVPGEQTYQSDIHFVLTSTRLHQTLLLSIGLIFGFAATLSRTMIIGIVIGYAIASAISLFVARVAQSRMGTPDTPSTLAADFDDLTRNRPWLSLFFFGLLQLTGHFIRGGGILFYFKYYCGDAALASHFWMLGSMTAILGMLFTKTLVRHVAKRTLMIVLNLGVAATTAGFYLLQPDQTTAMYILQAVAGLIGGPIPVLLWAMYADVADYSEWKTHRRATGLVFAAATFSQKLGCAIGAATTGFALDYFRYAPPTDGVEHPQSEFTIDGLRIMISIIPAIFLTLAALAMLAYDITGAMEQQVQSELARRKRPRSESGQMTEQDDIDVDDRPDVNS